MNDELYCTCGCRMLIINTLWYNEEYGMGRHEVLCMDCGEVKTVTLD